VRSGRVGVTRTRKRSGSFRVLGFLLSILLALASLPHQVTAHSAHTNDGLWAVTHHLDVESNGVEKGKSSTSGHCVSILSCFYCLPVPEQVLYLRASGVTFGFVRLLLHLGPTLELDLPPPRLRSQV